MNSKRPEKRKAGNPASSEGALSRLRFLLKAVRWPDYGCDVSRILYDASRLPVESFAEELLGASNTRVAEIADHLHELKKADNQSMTSPNWTHAAIVADLMSDPALMQDRVYKDCVKLHQAVRLKGARCISGSVFVALVPTGARGPGVLARLRLRILPGGAQKCLPHPKHCFPTCSEETFELIMLMSEIFSEALRSQDRTVRASCQWEIERDDWPVGGPSFTAAAFHGIYRLLRGQQPQQELLVLAEYHIGGKLVPVEGIEEKIKTLFAEDCIPHDIDRIYVTAENYEVARRTLMGLPQSEQETVRLVDLSARQDFGQLGG